MHILILGATGRTGVHAYKYALEQGTPHLTHQTNKQLRKNTGYNVTILIRDAAQVEPQERLTIVAGSCISESDMDRAFTAAGIPVNTVLSFLNARRVGANPWGKFLGPHRLVADSTALAIKALRAQKAELGHKPRLIVMNALGVGESYAVTPYLVRFMINYSNVSYSYDDHNAVNDEVEENCGDEVEWTLPLPVGLLNGERKPVRTFGYTESGASMFITRESCAMWMVDVGAGIEGDKFGNQRVIVSN